jgi:hypothetical protein
MKDLYDYAEIIHEKLKTIHPENGLLCGVTQHGDLVTDEVVGSGTHFNPDDFVEQMTFPHGLSVKGIRNYIFDV